VGKQAMQLPFDHVNIPVGRNVKADSVALRRQWKEAAKDVDHLEKMNE
jgi:hypothetical protein